MQTKTKSASAAEVAELRSEVSSLVGLVKELISSRKSTAQPKAGKAAASKPIITVAQVKALTAEDFDTLRYSLVVTNGDEKVLERNAKGQKQYKLVKGAKRSWYMGLKGLASTLHRGAEISEETAEGRERSQMEFAQDILSQMQTAGFIKLNQPKASSK